MELFRNRKFAVLIVVAVVLLATLLGVRGSLNRLARDVERMFYDGVFLAEEGFTQPGVNSHLINRESSALGLASRLEGRPELADGAAALFAARRELMDADSIGAKYAANENLQRAFVALTEKAQGLDLSQAERDDVESYASTFLGAQTAIQGSRYNQKVGAFMEDASFFAFILRPFLFITPPQAFA